MRLRLRTKLLVLAAALLATGIISWYSVECMANDSPVLENDTISFCLTDNYSRIEITDKRSGKVWTSSMDDPDYDLSSVSVKWQQKMTSLFTVRATNLEKGLGAINVYDLSGTDYTAEVYETEDGFGVVYDLTIPGICISLEFSLEEDGIHISIPHDGIDEYGGVYGLTSIDLMMFFGASVDGKEGYFFYPDGSGAIMEFDDQSHYAETSVTYDIYGDLETNEELLGRFEDEDPTVLLPVFGANYGDLGYVAYITSGQECSTITVVPSGSVIKANYMYASFITRRGFDDPRVTSSSIKTYDKELIDVDYEITYRFLKDGSSEYADMASAYREYLVSSNQIGDKNEDEDYTLIVDLFMGIKEEGVVIDTFRSVTSFDQAQEILGELRESVDGRILANLLGWMSGGYGSEPKYFPANTTLGGNSGLKSLTEFAAENGIEISLAANFLTVASDSSGYSKNTDIVYLSNYQVLTDLRESTYVMSPNTAYSNFSKVLKKAENYLISGLKLENLGNMVSYNYSSRNTVTAQECIVYWQQMIEETQETFGTVIVEGGNSYALAADIVMDIPLTDCGYQMTTESVPFFQLVTHGYVNYTGEALNLCSDMDRTILQWIEYGYLPYFELTYESAEELIQTDYEELFTSAWSSWKERVVEAYQEMKEALITVQNQAMVSHEKLEDGVYCTGYENGTRIYVNYNDAPVTVDGVEIEANSWTLREGK